MQTSKHNTWACLLRAAGTLACLFGRHKPATLAAISLLLLHAACESMLALHQAVVQANGDTLMIMI